MALTKDTKRLIDLIAPTLLAAGAGYVAFRKTKDWRVILVVFFLVWGVLYVVSSQITKAVKAAGEKPAHVKKPADTGSNTTNDFDPTSWVEQLHKDLYSTWSSLGHSSSLWASLAQLTNDNLIDIYNMWTDKYYSEYGETLVAAIAGDYFSGATYNNAKNVIDRLQANGAHF